MRNLTPDVGIGQAVFTFILTLVLASPVTAQIENQISAYTGPNATGYLQPLADAFGANLNDGFFHSADVPGAGPHFSLEFRLMAVIFDDDDATFKATTEPGFSPERTVDAPTVVGSGTAKTVNGDSGTSFTFPGGFDLNSFAIAVPQLRIGTVRGTEALVRFFTLDTGDVEIGDLTLFGIGARHSISQYFGPAFPVSLAAGIFWQTFKLGDDFIDSNAFSVGVQASKRFRFLEPYAGFSMDTFSMDVRYEAESGSGTTDIDLEFDTETTAHLTAGLAVRLLVLSAFGEYNVASQNSFSFGLAVGN